MSSDKHPARKHSTTIHRSLLQNMVLLIAMISGAILTAVYLVGVRSTVQSGAMSRIKNTEDTTEERLRLLFEGVRNHLVVARAWGEADLIHIEDSARLHSLFMPVLEKNPYVSAMMIADDRGREWYLARDDRARLQAPSRDPRQQVWYLGAMNSHFEEGIYWTRPYAFAATGEPGITASMRCDLDGNGQAETVVAFDVRLLDISEFTTSLYVSERGKTIVITDDGSLIGLPRVESVRGPDGGGQVVFSSVEQLGIAEISTAVEQWMTALAKRGEHFRFESGGEHWWGGFRYYDIGANRTLWIGVVVPEADFRAWADVWRNYTLLITAGAIGVAMLMATVLARRYGRPLASLAAESRRMRLRAESPADEGAVSAEASGQAAASAAEIGSAGIREIDALADDFRRMAIQVEQKSRALEDYSHTLEHKVAKRTEDLNQKNLQLMETLAELHETQQQLLLQEKMASLGNLVAGVAHELNSPIGAMYGAADVSRRCFDKLNGILANAFANVDIRGNSEFRKTLEVLVRNNELIIEGGRRVSDIVTNLKNFSRLDESELQPANLHEGLDSTLNLVQHMIKNRVEVVKSYGDIPDVMCYPNELNQVFMNLFTNAAQAIEGDGTITIETTADHDWVHVRVSDTGAGIKPENLDRVFEPGFTTKGVGVGTGLGLSISHRIVTKHGGTIHIQSEPGAGTEVLISLPVRPESTRSDAPSKEV